MVMSLASLYLTPRGATNANRSLLWLNFASFFGQFLLTFAFIFPVKDRLKAQQKKGEPYNDVEIRQNITAWERLHKLRILGSAVAFGASLVELVGFVR